MSQNNSLMSDETWMAEAIALARRGLYTTTPNPRVGCVILDKNGNKVGEGAHLKAGEPHAEVHALRQAGEQTRGGTAYVTLEPCSHYGRTPPCADALIAAGIGKVVVANLDPNPSVDGTGIDRLQDNGVEVVTGVLEREASVLNRGFFKRMRTKRPYVRVKMAASIDGRTALSNGKSKWITGPDARKDVQRFRAMSCAVVTGSGTVIDDNPSLLVREQQSELADYPDFALRQPLRVILDGERPLPVSHQIFNDQQQTLVLTTKNYKNAGFDESVEVVEMPTSSPRIDLATTLDFLGQRQCNEIWVEAGSTLAGAFLEQSLVDELIVYIAPKLIGNTGLPLLKLPQYEDLSQVPHLELQETLQIGSDLRLTYTLR
jgi:diaminohydroxyphosphoribosylaminopyrimidine deaminase/5-amino-6-(5-phosphoribosylamino)uracil reductase